MVQERTGKDWTPEDFSHKFRHAGLRYMIAVALGCSKIVKIAGGLPAGANPDKEMATTYLVPYLLPGEKLAADQGYRDGNKNFFTKFPKNAAITPRMVEIHRIIGLMGARHENVNQRFKSFENLNSRLFRHGRHVHRIIFTAVWQYCPVTVGGGSFVGPKSCDAKGRVTNVMWFCYLKNDNKMSSFPQSHMERAFPSRHGQWRELIVLAPDGCRSGLAVVPPAVESRAIGLQPSKLTAVALPGRDRSPSRRSGYITMRFPAGPPRQY